MPEDMMEVGNVPAAAAMNGAAAPDTGGEGGDAALQETPSTKECIEMFFRVQEKRATAYGTFSGAYSEFLKGGEEAAYNVIVEEVTDEFKALSEKVLAVEAALKAKGGEAEVIGGVVREVQDLEKEKLQMTCTIQVLRKSHAAGQWAWQREGGGASVDLGGGGAHAAGHDHAHGGGCGCGAEPTQAEYEGAVAEATQKLQKAVERINDCLEELRYELVDEE